jgi:enolase
MSDPRIAAVKGRQVWDSRGRPTVEVEVLLADGSTGRCIAPSGASTGRREALDKRDGGTRLGGYGVNHALAAVNGPIATLLRGMDAMGQIGIDAALLELDGTDQKTTLGGNAVTATSGAVAWAAAAARGVPLWRHLRDLAGMPADAPHIPAPIFGGGRHAGNRIDIQDFLILCIGATTFAEACEWTAEVYFAAHKLMRTRGKLNGIADEGGVWPDFTTNEDGLELLTAAIADAGFNPGRDIGICLDVASSSFFADGVYTLALEGRELANGGMIDMLEGWCDRYPIVSLEDPLAEDDDPGFAAITQRLGGKIQDRRLQRGPPQVQPMRHHHRAHRRHPDRQGPRLEHHHVRPLRRKRRRNAEPSHGGLDGRPDQGRLHRTVRADGQVERSHPHRGNDDGWVLAVAAAGLAA